METLPIATFVAITLSLVFEVVPVLNTKWNQLDKGQKGYINAGAVVVLTLVLALFQCQFGNDCPEDWFTFITATLVGVSVVNGMTYKLAARPYRIWLENKFNGD